MRISDWSSDVCSSDLAGEVLGLAGTLGSGRSELLHAIFGADPAATGTVLLDGTPVGRWPDEAVAAGIALVTEDRASQGYVPLLTLAENIALPRATGLLLDAEADRVAADAALAGSEERRVGKGGVGACGSRGGAGYKKK